jgi:DnaJ-class molecular chaperone
VLSDPGRRAQYDRFGRVFTDGRDRGPFGVADEVDLGAALGTMFRDLFRGRGTQPGATPRDLRYTVTVSLEEAARGTEKEIAFERREPGGGSRAERLKVRVPAGVDTGQKLKVAGKGLGGAGASGDLFVVVNVAEHEYWQRRGDDLFCELPVSFAQALLGSDVPVPTPVGPATVRLPARTQPGTVLTLKARGMPRLSQRGRVGGHGDLFAKVVLEMPEEPDAAQREQVLALDRDLSGRRSTLWKLHERMLKTAPPAGGGKGEA